jgi:hypothetical protein
MLAFQRIKVRKQLTALKPLVDAVKEDTRETRQHGNAAGSLTDFNQEGFQSYRFQSVRISASADALFLEHLIM